MPARQAYPKKILIRPGNQLAFEITHNDPRFTLVGNTIDKTANKPVGGTQVSITNSTQSSTAFATSAKAMESSIRNWKLKVIL